MKIRKMKSGDLELVKNIAGSTGSEPDEIKKVLKNDEIFVVESDNKFVGFISLRKKGSIFEITELAVAPQFQNEGFGGELLTYARELAKLRGAKGLWVRTSNDNIPALTLYQKFGFKITDVKLGVLIKHHGREILGWGGIPVRDEIMLKLKFDNVKQ